MAGEYYVFGVSTVQDIETALSRLSVDELETVREFLDDLLESQLEVTPEFKEKIARGQAEIARGEYARVRKPGA